MTQAVRCKQCGGAVAASPGKEIPECLFCGAPARDLQDFAVDESIEPPRGAIPFTVDKAKADNAFREFATSSFWYPNDLRSARLELRRLLLPAWAWSADAETHWAGLVAANTRSGKRPVAGVSTAHFDQILVPASETLTLRELAGLGRYDETAMAPWSEDTAEDPYEISQMTRSVAREAARQEIERRHARAIASTEGTVSLNVATVVSGMDGRPVLVPVWIGAYRYGDRVFRILVNGQTGQLLGDAPKSLWKRLFVFGGVILAVLAIVACLSMCTGGAAIFGS